MVIAIMVLFIGLLLASASVLAARSTNGGAKRDRGTKRAVQAADAGLSAAIFRMNRLKTTDSATQIQCAASSSGNASVVTVAKSAGWCPAVTESIGNGETYSYVVSAASSVTGAQTTLDRTIVATGTVNGVTRRVAVKASLLQGAPLFGDATMISLSGLDLGSSDTINGNVRSNGNISLSGAAKICGTATAGPGKTVNKPEWLTPCSTYATASAATPLVLSPLDQGNAATVNDNARICTLDPCSNTHGIAPYTNTPDAPRRLKVSSDTTVVLGGNVYSFCSVDLSGAGKLQIAARDPGTSVRIFLDAPEACGQTGNPVTQFSNSGSDDIVNLNSDPTTLQIYAAGSSTIPTNISFSGYSNISAPLALYAPLSTVSLSGSTRITGAIAAKTINASGDIVVTSAPSTATLSSTSVTPISRAAQYRECRPVPPTPSDPTSGC